MSYSVLLQVLYPTIKKSDYKLQDDGEGVHIKEWNFSELQPNEELTVLCGRYSAEIDAKVTELQNENKQKTVTELQAQVTDIQTQLDNLNR